MEANVALLQHFRRKCAETHAARLTESDMTFFYEGGRVSSFFFLQHLYFDQEGGGHVIFFVFEKNSPTPCNINNEHSLEATGCPIRSYFEDFLIVLPYVEVP